METETSCAAPCKNSIVNGKSRCRNECNFQEISQDQVQGTSLMTQVEMYLRKGLELFRQVRNDLAESLIPRAYHPNE